MRHVIIYVSTVNPLISENDIRDLMEYVKKNNILYRITGILIYSDGNFFQVLEGKTEIVKILYERIKRDVRHHNIIKLLDKKIECNILPRYYSTFCTIPGKSVYTELENFLKEEKVINPEHFDSVYYLSHKFMKLL